MIPLILAAVVRVAVGLSHAPDQTAIDAIEREARAQGVPVSLALAVCTIESGLGTRGRILCGCYVRRRDADGRLVRDRHGRLAINTDLDAQAQCAALSLRHARQACGAWAPALRRYNQGHGCPLADPRGYVSRAIRYQRALAGRLGERLLAD